MYARCLPMSFQRSFGDVATCENRAALGCSNEAAIAGEGFLPSAVEDCAQEISGSDCDSFVFPTQAGPRCAQMATNPAGHLGAPCSVGLQCASGVCAPGPDDSSGCGTCSPPTNVDDACAVTCSYGQFCDLSTGACSQPGKLGARCDADTPFMCEAGLICHGAVCKGLLFEGDACDDASLADSVCDSQRELVCDGLRCVKWQPTVVGLGQPCNAEDGVTICGARSYCDTIGSSTKYTCVPEIPDGGHCNGFDQNHCLFPMECIDEQCALPDPPTCK